MDRNGKPNPFAAFDEIIPKTTGNATAPKAAPVNAFEGFSASSSAVFAASGGFASAPVAVGGFAPIGGFSSSPSPGGNFAPTQPIRQGTSSPAPVVKMDAFGFPIATGQIGTQPIKVNPFDAFGSKSIPISKSTTPATSFDFTASASRAAAVPILAPTDSKGQDLRSKAFDGFSPSNSLPPKIAYDPFASMINAPPATTSAPIKPHRPVMAPVATVAVNTSQASVPKPAGAFNPFENDSVPPKQSNSTSLAAPVLASSSPSKNSFVSPLPSAVTPVAAPAFQHSPAPAPARVFAQSANVPPINVTPPNRPLSSPHIGQVFIPAPAPASRTIAGWDSSVGQTPNPNLLPISRSASTLEPSYPSPTVGAVPNSFNDSNCFGASPQKSQSSTVTPTISSSNSFSISPSQPVTMPTASDNSNPFSVVERTDKLPPAPSLQSSSPIVPISIISTSAKVLTSPFQSQPPPTTVTDISRTLASPTDPTSPSSYKSNAMPLAIYKGIKKTKAFTARPVAAQGSAFNRRKDQSPIWSKSYFADLFTKAYFDDATDISKSQSIANVRQSIRTVRDSLFRMVTDKESFLETRYSAMVSRALELFDSGCEIFEKFPSRSGDNDKLYSFIDFFMQRVRGMPVGGVLLVPLGWLTETGVEKSLYNNVTGGGNKAPAGSSLGTECAAVVILSRHRGTAEEKDFNVTIVNTNNIPDSGFDYHAVKIDPTDGALLHNLSFELRNIENERIYNTAFWLILFKSGVFSNVKFGSKFIYERVLPYLTLMPITHTMTSESERVDFFPLPVGGDKSGINCALECLRHVIRQQGADELQATHVPMMVKWDILKSIQYEMSDLRAILPLEIDMIRMACRAVARSAAAQVGPKTEHSTTTVSAAQLSSISESITFIELQLTEMDERKTAPPAFSLIADERLAAVCDWPLFGRLRRDFDVEALAGDAPVAPIIRPVEMTLVPDRVSDFQEVAAAMRHTLNLCILLANQRTVVRNSYTLRVCMLEHLFVRVIPLPLPITHKSRDTQCFWHAQLMRYETQADILHLLSKLSIHFATASLSVKSTRSGDAVRMLTFACIATVCDATLRKIACDIPSQSSLHYSGRAKGPVSPFGFDLGTFEEESEYLKLSTPEAAVARTQVLDYFHQMKKVVSPDHILFSFEKGSECCIADRLYVDQICLQMGFKRGEYVPDLTSPTRGLLQLYPEIASFRDIIFMFKLVMVPTLDMLPEVKCWEPEEAVLSWAAAVGATNNVQDSIYSVTGFGRRLECTHLSVSVEEQQLKYKLPKGIFSRFLRYVGVGAKKPRSTPSQANPSILLGERVDTEDDILHIRNLPDFDGTLGAKDCELMLQYLTAPYMRIPLLLNFFSNEVRLKTLRNKEMQEVLDAAMFEPGQWKSDHDILLPSIIPAADRNHLCTPVGLLFNEIVMSPNVILTAILEMLERVVDMDSGKYSELGESILYVTRLAIRVEGYLLFLIRNKKFHTRQTSSDSRVYNGSYTESDVRGLRCGEDVIQEAFTCQKKIRVLLEEKMFKIIARWIKKSKKDGMFGQACMLHAHLAFIYRNVEEDELSPRIVFTVLASQIFLFNYHKYDLDVESESKKNGSKESTLNDPNVFDFVIPNVELFGMFQRNRRMILQWLQRSPDDRNKVGT